jgi:hypothetical protein
MLAEWMIKGKPSVLGVISGAVAGLVAVTPAAGFVLPTGVVHTLTTEGTTGESVYSSQLNGYRTPVTFKTLTDEHHVALNLLITGRRHGNGW